MDAGTQPSPHLPLKSSKMEAGIKAVEYFFHRAVISAPLFPNLISCPIFKVAKKKKERKGMLLAASESANSTRGLLFPPSGGNSTLGGDFRRETKKSIPTKLEVCEKFWGEERLFFF